MLRGPERLDYLGTELIAAGRFNSSLMHEGYLERIEGPFKGYYIAAYAGPAKPGGGYVGYAKVCRSRPVSYWEADCLLKDGIGLGMRTPQEAMAVTMELARRQIALLPPIEELPAVYRYRPIQSYERSEFGLWGRSLSPALTLERPELRVDST